MSLLVVAYPEIDKKHYDWIREFRKDYDELYYEVIL